MKRGADRKRGHVMSIKKALEMAGGERRSGGQREARWRMKRRVVADGETGIGGQRGAWWQTVICGVTDKEAQLQYRW